MQRMTTVATAIGLALLVGACGGDAEPGRAAAAAGTAAAPADPVLTALDDYERRARALAKQLGAAGEPAALREASTALVDLSATVAPAFAARQPQCAAYLDAALRVREAWPTLDVATIERDYHDDGALPKVAEGGAACYHMKDLIVHPATVLVLLAQPELDRAQARKEIDEVLAHVGAVRATLTVGG